MVTIHPTDYTRTFSLDQNGSSFGKPGPWMNQALIVSC